MFAVNLGISLKSGISFNLGIFGFLVLFLCFHEFQFRILFVLIFFFFFFFVWLAIWVISEEEGLLDKL